MNLHRPPHTESAAPPVRPWLADQPSRFMQLEREVEREFQPRLLAALQERVNAVAEETHSPFAPVRDVGERWACMMIGQCPGWPVLAACTPVCGAIVAQTAATNADPCWAYGEWSLGALADL